MHRLLATAAALLTFGTLLLLAGGVGMFLGPDSLVPSGLNITMTSLRFDPDGRRLRDRAARPPGHREPPLLTVSFRAVP